jgi:electron transport complex protein RnfG
MNGVGKIIKKGGTWAWLFTFLCVLVVLFFVVENSTSHDNLPEDEQALSPYESVFSEYDSLYPTRVEDYEDDDVHRVYKLGEGRYGFLVSEEGYEDEILFFVEISESRIKSVEVLAEQETADYGGHVTERWFLDRLLLSTENELKAVRYRKKNENEVIAITGATITSRAAVKAVNRCIEKWGEMYDE